MATLDGLSEITVNLSVRNEVECGENATIYANCWDWCGLSLVTLNIKIPSEL
jgi:hypothetical protein